MLTLFVNSPLIHLQNQPFPYLHPSWRLRSSDTPSVLSVCPKAAAKILPDIPSDPLWIPLAGFPWPPAIILHSLSSSFSILHSTLDFPSRKTMTRHLFTGFVLDHPSSKDLVLEGENQEQPLKMPEWQQCHGKILPVPFLARRDKFVECRLKWAGGNLLWWCWRVHLEEGVCDFLSRALCYVLPALNYTLYIRNAPLPSTGHFRRCFGEHVKAGKTLRGEGRHKDADVCSCALFQARPIAKTLISYTYSLSLL